MEKLGRAGWVVWGVAALALSLSGCSDHNPPTSTSTVVVTMRDLASRGFTDAMTLSETTAVASVGASVMDSCDVRRSNQLTLFGSTDKGILVCTMNAAEVFAVSGETMEQAAANADGFLSQNELVTAESIDPPLADTVRVGKPLPGNNVSGMTYYVCGPAIGGEHSTVRWEFGPTTQMTPPLTERATTVVSNQNTLSGTPEDDIAASGASHFLIVQTTCQYFTESP